MPATGELIRLMNYIDDIATTLRRISASIPAMTKEECARLAEYIHRVPPNAKGSPRTVELEEQGPHDADQNEQEDFAAGKSALMPMERMADGGAGGGTGGGAPKYLSHNAFKD